MNSLISRYIRFHPVKTQRGLEILSGIMPWGVIFFVILGSFVIPDTIAYFVLTFNVYWLYRSLQMSILAVLGYFKLKENIKIDWIEKLKSDEVTKNRYLNIYHLIIIPNYKEPLTLLERNVESLTKQNFDSKRIFVVLAMEEREGEGAVKKVEHLKSKYKNKFGMIIGSFHKLVPGETIGKHSNNTFAAKIAKKILVDQKGLPIDKIMTTQCDVDTVFPRQYLSLLTYKFLTVTWPFNKIYQAPVFMYNNAHRLPLILRALAISSGIQYLALFQKPSGRFVNISVYSLPLKLLHFVNYWDVDVIPEDWHINLKIFFALKGDLQVTPIYLPVYIDAAESTSKWKTIVNSYYQARRWAWGIVDVPYVLKKFFLHPEVPFVEKILKVITVIETHFVWSSWWFIVVLGATIPTLINPAFGNSAVGYNLSKTSSGVLTIGLIGIFVIIILDTLLNPHYKSRLQHILDPKTYLPWLLSPLAGLFFSAIPGIESQTRLLLGKYMEYRVTEKV